MMRARAGKRYICGPFSTPLVAFHSSSELEGGRCYRLTIITNADDESDDVIERVTEADGGVEKSRSSPNPSALKPSANFVAWHFIRYRSARVATPNAKLIPIWPSTDNGCRVMVRRDPPINTLAPNPKPNATLPLAPT
jgi:hypothetical protein